jgi:hypothetical protein
MRVKVLFFLSAFIISIAFSSCKKYDYGPFISFKSKENRIVNKWKLVKVIKEDQDETYFYLKGIKEFSIEFKSDGYLSKNITDSLGKSYLSEDKWIFNDDKMGIYAILDDYHKLYYNIQKLTTKELWLYREYYNKSRYEFEICN